MSVVNFVAAASGGGGPPPSGTTNELIPSTGTRVDYGEAIAVSRDGTTIAVGDPGANSGKGAVWIFTDPDEDGAWAEESRIDEASYTAFGRMVHLSSDGNTLAVVATNGSNSAVRVYTRSGGTYTLQDTIAKPASVNAPWVLSGFSIDDSGDRLALGSFNAVHTDGTTGTLHVLKRTSGTYAVEQDLTGELAGFDDTGDNIGTGYTVAISGDATRLAVIQKLYGIIDIYSRSGTTWTFEHYFNWDGCAVAMLDQGGATLVVLNQYIDEASAPHKYATRSGTTWTEIGTIDTSGYPSGTSTTFSTHFQNSAALSTSAQWMVIGNVEGGTSSPEVAGRVLTFESFVEGDAVNNPGSTANGVPDWGTCAAIAGDGLFFAATAPQEVNGRAWVYYL